MRAEISVLEGSSQGQCLELDRKGTYAIGRSTKNDLTITDRKVSRQHCRVEYDGEFFWLTDSESVNGTIVNDRKIQKYLLFDGDVIVIGKTKLLFRLRDERQQGS